MKTSNYNPDVLSCLANLSSDEVFTPPKLANEILDLLPKEIWRDKNASFLDPVCKSGVFLREIAKRLLEGLKEEIPDVQKRIDHIYKNQLFGIGITELTALISRRSLYCSKNANGGYSVTSFSEEKGNIFFEKTAHNWKKGRCSLCGASKTEYEREEDLETYAYQFIHDKIPNIIKSMKFDVIIGNPPYQLSDGGGRDSGAVALYHNFVLQAIKLSPRYLTMIIPARWYSGGKGLDEFRLKMLSDERLAQIHDFPETSDCFPGVNIRGGVCYFLWDKQHTGHARIVNHKSGEIISETKRPLLEDQTNIFIRYNEAISILNKVRKFKEKVYSNVVSARKPFGIDSNFSDFSITPTKKNKILLYRVGGIGYVDEIKVPSNRSLIANYKVIVSKASPGGDEYPHMIISKPIIAEPGSCCTETYLVVDVLKNRREAKNLTTYMSTRFFRFLMSLVKNTQNISRSVFEFVPIVDLTEEWSDEKLYKKYKITKEEQSFINTLIRPMN